MKAHQFTVFTLVIALLNLGCHYSSQIGPIYDSNRPVMLGKVQTIGGATKQLGIKKREHDISHYSGYRLIAFSKASFVEGSFGNSFNEYGELKKNVNEPDNLIKVDRVYFGSNCFIFVTIFLLNIVSCQSTTGIDVSIYTGNSTEKIEDTVTADVRMILGGEP